MDLGERQVTQLAFGAWQSLILYTLAELNIFAGLADGPLTAEMVAGRRNLDPVATSSLLDAGVALRLLHKRDDTYTNSELSARLLTGDSDGSLLEWVRMMGRWTQAYTQLTDVVRTGRPARGNDLRHTSDPSYLIDQGLGLYRFAVRHADELAACVDPPIQGRLIDLGGGFGAYSMALCRRSPQLRAVIWELADLVPLARQAIAERGMANQVTVVARDYTSEEYGEGIGAILMSNVLHQEPRETAAGMLRRAYGALTPGGRLIVNGSFLQDDRTGPPFSALHNLSATVLWEGGRDFTLTEMSELVQATGFDAPQVFPLGEGSAHLLVAVAGDPS